MSIPRTCATSGHMATAAGVFWFFLKGRFTNSVRLDVECLAGCDFFRALDGQQLLVVESVPCCAN